MSDMAVRRKQLEQAQLMDNKQPDALRLADAIDQEFVGGRISNHSGRKAAAELRRQHAQIEMLREFAEEARRSGCTRLASMAVAILNA